ncbi:MAG: hypothetical protein M3071_10560 [Actinomycetota bacterium]|nr:hypothetical protein [Actinomycetota bacterium]
MTTCGLSAPAVAASRHSASRQFEHGGDRHHGFGTFLWPGNLLISRSVYENDPNNIVPGVTLLPAGCAPANCVKATTNAAYPFVFNNDTVDSSFGITSKIFLDQLTPWGHRISTLEVPSSAQWGVGPSSDQMVTSFSSKSEIALNLSTSGRYVTFMGYLAPIEALDVSNSNTQGVVDPTNPVTVAYYRVVAQLDRWGRFHFTLTNAYSGNNGRAAILNDKHGSGVLYTSGNAGNGGNPQPDGIILGAGAQILSPSYAPEAVQSPGTPTPVGSFNVTQLGDKADKIGKDTNFRGLTIHDNVVYYTKGSGGNGVNTVYFVDTTGTACPNGSGVPAPGAPLPTSPIAYDPALLQTQGVTPYNMCVLNGFPTVLAKNDTTFFPFGLWFANSHTLYVSNEGDGTNTFSTTTGTYTPAAAQTTSGLQKWVLNGNAWQLAYTLQSGLNLGQPYTVPGYPTGNNPTTGLPWAPATDGLRNITGRVGGYRDGKVTIWGVTSTVSGSGDQGADPNKVVAITDDVGATTPSAGESFQTVKAAASGEVLRGVSFTPDTESDRGW